MTRLMRLYHRRVGQLGLGLLVALVAFSALAAREFEIRKLRVLDDQLVAYHAPIAVPEGARVKVALTTGGCRQVSGPQPLAESGDPIAMLIVLDRGGTPTTGMGRHSAAIIAGVRGFLSGQAGANSKDVFAIVDSAGATKTPDVQQLTSDVTEAQQFLDALPDPSESGADIYSNTRRSLLYLKQSSTPLRLAVVISDGIDPNATRGDGAPTALSDRARKDGVPIYAIAVNRSADPNSNRVRLQSARKQLSQVAEATGGADVVPVADDGLALAIQKALSQTLEQWRALQVTECTLCDSVTAGHLGATMNVIAPDGSVLDTSTSGEQSVEVAALPELGTCGCVAEQDCNDCGGDRIGKCSGGSCECVAKCGGDSDCVDGKTCKDGRCEATGGSGPSTRTLVAGGAVSFALLLGGLAFARSRRRAAEPEPFLDLDSFPAPAPFEPPPVSEPVVNREPPAAFVLRNTTVHTGDDIPLRVGTTVVGADPGCDVCLDLGSISSRHARFDVSSDGLITLTDLDSSNGTYVNELRIAANKAVELRVGDQVALSKRLQLVLVASGK